MIGYITGGLNASGFFIAKSGIKILYFKGEIGIVVI